MTVLTDDDRRGIGARRRLVFQNLANGVPPETVRTQLRLSELELEQERSFVAKKITERQVLRREPPIPCEDVRTMRWHRRQLLGVLAKIGDLDLSSSLILSRVTVQAIDHPEMIDGATRRMAEAYR